MNAIQGHFVKLTEFSEKALFLPPIKDWVESESFDLILQGTLPFEEARVITHLYNEYERSKSDPGYQGYYDGAYKDVIDEIDGHFIDNTVNKRKYVEKFNTEINKVIDRLKEDTSIRLLKEKYSKLDWPREFGIYFQHNFTAIKNLIAQINGWIGQLEMLQDYLDEKYKPYLRTEPATEALVNSTLTQNQDVKAPADQQQIRERTKTYAFPYLVTLGILFKYHEKFNGEHWETIDIQSFIACIDCKRAPEQNLILKNVFLFCYFLSKLTPEIGAVKINDFIALEFFGITGYHSTVTKAKDTPNRKIKVRLAIDAIFNSTKYTLK